ncbi:hypothetical protein B0A49_06064 [Cryomyces minteri]|uniref:NAD(P)-binding domain-containing protein n=1 Tax=Cryomyces minteri TaxID=331657 RepID=A0A4U0X270_9PEZI|nr:hypothetical protein B0A49_06064 [Cryomyces minteri]
MAPRRVLLTGANGFIGAHILSQLLDRDVCVRAVVRSEAKAAALRADFASHAPQLDLAIVPDMTADGAYTGALRSTDAPFDTFIHTASPFLYKGGLALKAVKAHAGSVERVIITSSFAAVAPLADQAAMTGKVYTEADWNPITWEQAVQDESNRNAAYQGRARTWKFLETEKPNFDIVTFAPPMVYGPLQHTVKKISDLNQSNDRIYRLFIDSSKNAELPVNGIYLYTDPRDLAAAHVSAVFTPAASNQRFLICAGKVSSQRISDILRAHVPELAERAPIGTPGKDSLPENPYGASSRRAEEVLGVTYRSAEETFVQLARQLLEIEEREKEEGK